MAAIDVYRFLPLWDWPVWYLKEYLYTFAIMRRGLENTTRTPSYYVDEDYPAGPEINNLSVNEATDVAQIHPLWRLMSTFGATHY